MLAFLPVLNDSDKLLLSAQPHMQRTIVLYLGVDLLSSLPQGLMESSGVCPVSVCGMVYNGSLYVSVLTLPWFFVKMLKSKFFCTGVKQIPERSYLHNF